jgi:hypothetical protein
MVKPDQWVWLLMGLACTSAQQRDPQLWRPPPGAQAERIPGPLTNFGPYDDFSDALKAACPLILSKPNATVVHLQDKNPQLALRVSTEYCAWLYYTPAHKYELSLLSDQEEPGDIFQESVSCLIPSSVEDARYPPDSIKHIFILHNHPFAGEISGRDIHLAIAMAQAHGLVTSAGQKNIPLSVIAFFSNSKDERRPTCDGFYQYIPATSELMKWRSLEDGWHMEKAGRVQWEDAKTFRILRD